MKKIIYTILVLVIIIAVAITFMIDPMGKKYSQKYAQELLKTPVSISQFNTSFSNKSLNIDFIEVQNPPGFQNRNALSLDHFSLEIADEATTDFIVLEELRLSGLEFVLEQSGTDVNLSKLMDALKQGESSSSDSKDADSDYDADERRIRIKTFKVENITLKVDTEWLKTTIKVPNISASNFGGDAGIEVDEIGKQIAQEIFENLQKALEKKGIDAGKDKIQETLMRKIGSKIGIDNLQEKVDFDNIKDSLGDLFQEKTGNDLKEKAKDLFKGFGF
ncbi:hypothetical protein [Candidatus Thioglobus sp.]|uniref:hypothetical protein n=1 Tax=Candidatus Thioglobus sp. TaxID=2026721 RepID=UPI003D10FE6B